jgi:hypothetical protein
LREFRLKSYSSDNPIIAVIAPFFIRSVPDLVDASTSSPHVSVNGADFSLGKPASSQMPDLTATPLVLVDHGVFLREILALSRRRVAGTLV